MSSIVAVNNNPHIKVFYQRFVADKPKLLGLFAFMRKLLTIFMLRDGKMEPKS